MRGKTRVFKLRLVLVLNLIGRESGASFLSRRSFGIALVFDYLAVRLIQKTRATFSTSQILRIWQIICFYVEFSLDF